jgi:hypothetical protein
MPQPPQFALLALVLALWPLVPKHTVLKRQPMPSGLRVLKKQPELRRNAALA